MIREASCSQALLGDDEYCEEMQGSGGDESVDVLFGMALFVGLFAVVFACIAVKCGGWFFWVGAAVCVLVSGLMFFASYRLFKDEDEHNSEDSGSER